jgi:hypothetical protein
MGTIIRKPGLLLGFAALAWGVTAQGASTGYPGIVNYVEGQVSVGGSRLAPSSAGKADAGQNQVLETRNGKAEMLLTPGVFLRVGNYSAVRMISPSLTDTRVQVLKGQTLVEVTELFKQNHLRVLDNGSTTDLLKKGIYEFDANSPRVAVYDGKAQVRSDDSQVTVTKGKAVALTPGPLRVEKFDRKQAEQQDGLYQWSSLRSEYLAEASWDSARTIVVNDYPWWGAGWYWNPYWGMYSFIPADGLRYSPFGWGFYSPWYVWRAPVVGHVFAPHGRGVIRPPAVFRRPAIDMPRMGISPTAGFHSFGHVPHR